MELVISTSFFRVPEFQADFIAAILKKSDKVEEEWQKYVPDWNLKTRSHSEGRMLNDW